MRPYLKNKAKRAERVAQVVEHLPSKCKGLYSNANTMERGEYNFEN
jgi:hypothetical protein